MMGGRKWGLVRNCVTCNAIRKASEEMEISREMNENIDDDGQEIGSDVKASGTKEKKASSHRIQIEIRDNKPDLKEDEDLDDTKDTDDITDETDSSSSSSSSPTSSPIKRLHSNNLHLLSPPPSTWPISLDPNSPSPPDPDHKNSIEEDQDGSSGATEGEDSLLNQSTPLKKKRKLEVTGDETPPLNGPSNSSGLPPPPPLLDIPSFNKLIRSAAHCNLTMDLFTRNPFNNNNRVEESRESTSKSSPDENKGENHSVQVDVDEKGDEENRRTSSPNLNEYYTTSSSPGYLSPEDELKVTELTPQELAELKEDLRRKFQCPYCSKRYLKKHYATRHVRQIHTQRIRYNCRICSRSFTQYGSLSRHLKSIHHFYIKK